MTMNPYTLYDFLLFNFTLNAYNNFLDRCQLKVLGKERFLYQGQGG